MKLRFSNKRSTTQQRVYQVIQLLLQDKTPAEITQVLQVCAASTSNYLQYIRHTYKIPKKSVNMKTGKGYAEVLRPFFNQTQEKTHKQESIKTDALGPRDRFLMSGIIKPVEEQRAYEDSTLAAMADYELPEQIKGASFVEVEKSTGVGGQQHKVGDFIVRDLYLATALLTAGHLLRRIEHDRTQPDRVRKLFIFAHSETLIQTRRLYYERQLQLDAYSMLEELKRLKSIIYTGVPVEEFNT